MISIFALPCYIGHSYSKNSELSARRLSSRIRGEEIAEYLGAKFNPTEGYENDIRIYVKPRDLNIVRDGDYVDHLDGEFRWQWFLRRPGIRIIAASLCSYEFLKQHLKNEVFLIPSHHFNVERLRRDRKEIKVAGYICKPSPETFKRHEEIRERLAELGMDYVVSYYFKTRQDSIDLYKQVDMFVFGDWDSLDHPFRIPTKIINAASFGIPSVAYPMMSNKENEGYYLPARNMEETIEAVKKLKDETFYNKMVEKVVPWAENYHISRIAELYRKLK